MPIGLALIAGGLSTLNPCGFSLLPAMLTLYVGGEVGEDASTAARMSASLRAGGRVTAGFLSVFIVVGVPVVYGLGGIVRAIQWAGAISGVAITVAGVILLAGRNLSFGLNAGSLARHGHGRPSLFLFGIAYAVASLGCTLPVFLSVMGASLAVRGPAAATVVLAAYAVGMSVVMMTLALAAGGVRQRLVKALRRVLPRVHKVSGALLVVAGLYLSYYWGRILFGPVATLGDDPVGRVQRFTTRIERIATANATTILTASMFVMVAVGVYLLWRLFRSREGPSAAAGNDLSDDVSERRLERLDAGGP